MNGRLSLCWLLAAGLLTTAACGTDENDARFGALDQSLTDSDGDGLYDAEEARIGTDPNDADTDGDGVSDGDEVDAGTDPMRADSETPNTPTDPPDPIEEPTCLDEEIPRNLIDDDCDGQVDEPNEPTDPPCAEEEIPRNLIDDDCDGMVDETDAQPCRTDGACEEGQICVDWRCVEAPSGPCETDADCGHQEVCIDGDCVINMPAACETDDDCAEGELCLSGLCFAAPSGGDYDGDGFTESEGDCDDYDPYAYPGAPEVRDGVDNDCDGFVDEA